MLLSEEVASSLKVLFNRFIVAIPNMTDQELYNCLRILNKSQTEAEKSSASTIDKNGKGFTSIDAEPFTDAMKEYAQNGRFVKFHTRNLVRYRLRKYADQLIRFWINRGAINKVKRGEYSYESKAERLARLAAQLQAQSDEKYEQDMAKLAKGAAEYRRQQEEEMRARKEREKTTGQLDLFA